MGRKSPVNMKDRTQLLTDPRAQDLVADTGAKRSLNTNIRDLGPSNNTNALRFKRGQSYSSNLVLDGGPNYTPNTCVGNWSEERQDRDWNSGFHARELGFQKIYQSTYTVGFRPTSSRYYNQVRGC